ncbi:hypothetical protein HAX54_011833, partial [Datura stramonium]|nr:hypothetical protein [Datura stramonium]
QVLAQNKAGAPPPPSHHILSKISSNFSFEINLVWCPHYLAKVLANFSTHLACLASHSHYLAKVLVKFLHFWTHLARGLLHLTRILVIFYKSGKLWGSTPTISP